MRSVFPIVLGGAACTIVLVGVGLALFVGRGKSAPRQAPVASFSDSRAQKFGDYTLWLDELPAALRELGINPGSGTNIHPADYAGPEACKNCHKRQYESWSTHPHRWMNSRVADTTIHGDFDDCKVSYLGGEVTTFRAGDEYRMRLQRGDVQREFSIQQTIGSRFFQYYVGTQLQGPEPADHPLYSDLHVLPMGYWIDRKEWVPIVHVRHEAAEGNRDDPFVPRPPIRDLAAYYDTAPELYRASCNFCHTTFAVGDMFVRMQPLLGRHIPTQVDMSLFDYVQGTRPELWPQDRPPSKMSDAEFIKVLRDHHGLEASENAVTLGISCEACHLGSREHAEGKQKRPKFFPSGPELVIRSKTSEYDLGRTHDNVNYACARCHAGDRPAYANGIATWNSTEYTDAMKGSCYSQLTCIQCHNPHESIGHEWSHTPVEDDAVCVRCHQKFEKNEIRQAHTHHPLNHEGSRCMNCHMPRINEGIQEVVRTHTIFSPTDRTMIESNQVNACNQCHGDKPIDWTLTHLKDWYGKTYDKSRIAAHYPNREQPVAIGWLKGKNEAVRLVAADSLARTNSTWALPELLQALDDEYMLNRQFARISLEPMLGLKLKDFGYQFFMTKEERVDPLQKLRAKLLPETKTSATTAR